MYEAKRAKYTSGAIHENQRPEAAEQNRSAQRITEWINADLLDLIPCDIIKRLRAKQIISLGNKKKDVRNVNSGIHSLLCNLYILVGSADPDPMWYGMCFLYSINKYN